MTPVAAQPMSESTSAKTTTMVIVAWVVAAVFHFYQYSLRSAPSVMMADLSAAFGISTLAVASISGLFYYGYAPFNLVAGAAIDELGPRRVLPIGAVVVAIGVMLFATGDPSAASVGRLLQGVGAAFAAVGGIYMASKYFPASQTATLVGATQMFGMAGGAAGQFAVAPILGAGVSWKLLWAAMSVAGIALAVLLAFVLPKKEGLARTGWLKPAGLATYQVLKNPQSILCGLIAGLLFIPTTIFGMIWGIQYLQEAHGFDYGTAVMRSAAVPLGWIIGCPLLGYLSDRVGRRKPVIVGGALVLLACLGWILFGRPGVFPPYTLGLLAGVASGAAMLPYSVIKEANPAEFGGTATGVINFLNFTLSALLAPVFANLLHRTSHGADQRALTHYQMAFIPMLVGVSLAIVLTFVLRETGPAAKRQSEAAHVHGGFH